MTNEHIMCKRPLRLLFVLSCLLFSGLSRADQYGDFTFSSDGTNITISGYTGLGGAITIPSNINGVVVNNIKKNAFSYQTNLTGVVIPNSITNIGNNAFSHCGKLASVALPSNITSVAYGAFLQCYALSKITIPDRVQDIQSYAFYACTSLTNIVIPNAVTNIEDYAFYACTNLSGLALSSGLKGIGTYAFGLCPGLTTVTIPSTVTNIGNGAFSSCPNLTQIYFNGNAPSAGANVFDGDSKLLVYYLPQTTGWGTTFCGRPTTLAGQSIHIQMTGKQIVLTWPQGVLLETTNLTKGAWITNTATSPFTLTPEDTQKFYRFIGN